MQLSVVMRSSPGRSPAATPSTFRSRGDRPHPRGRRSRQQLSRESRLVPGDRYHPRTGRSSGMAAGCPTAAGPPGHS